MNNDKVNTNKVGRPKITLDKFPRGWKKKVIDIGKAGGSDTKVKIFLKLSNDAFYRLLKEEPEFSEAIFLARQYSQGFWEDLGVDGAKGDIPINARVWELNMKNRFRWTDRQETNTQLSLSDELKGLANKLPD